MTIRHLAIATLVAAFAAGTTPTVVLTSTARAAESCGFANQNGTLVFLGTCPNEAGESSDKESPPSSHCAGNPNVGPVYSYRLELAVC